ncbi:hypothetical protein H2203_007260 [Taxawa tesnikishii (nom. ined.)]|nr:hypothetical protein H2203_007260 [Dothideales sp. JES 119]
MPSLLHPGSNPILRLPPMHHSNVTAHASIHARRASLSDLADLVPSWLYSFASPTTAPSSASYTTTSWLSDGTPASSVSSPSQDFSDADPTHTCPASHLAIAALLIVVFGVLVVALMRYSTRRHEELELCSWRVRKFSVSPSRRCSYVNSRASSRRNSFEHECHEAESKIPTIHVQDVSMPDNEITRKLQGYSMA